MTEHELWTRMAELWENAVPGFGYKGAWWVPKYGYGLCETTRNILRDAGLSYGDPARDRLIDKIDAALPTRRIKDDYCWPCDRRGAKTRAAFCHKMAEQTRGQASET